MRSAPGAGRWCASRWRAPLLPRFLALGARLPRLALRRRPPSADGPPGRGDPAPAGMGRTGGSRPAGSRSHAPGESARRSCRGGRVAGVAITTKACITVNSTSRRRRSRCLSRILIFPGRWADYRQTGRWIDGQLDRSAQGNCPERAQGNRPEKMDSVRLGLVTTSAPEPARRSTAEVKKSFDWSPTKSVWLILSPGTKIGSMFTNEAFSMYVQRRGSRQIKTYLLTIILTALQ